MVKEGALVGGGQHRLGQQRLLLFEQSSLVLELDPVLLLLRNRSKTAWNQQEKMACTSIISGCEGATFITAAFQS